MGYSIYAVGDRVRIWHGGFSGVVGTVQPLDSAPEEIVNIKGFTYLTPVLVRADIDGVARVLCVPPEFLERT